VVLAPRDPSPTGPISRYGYSQTWTGTDCSVHIDDSRDAFATRRLRVQIPPVGVAGSPGG
jgi:hypothetical protein